MALEDFVLELSSHQFGAVLHFWQLGSLTQAQAKSIVESPRALNRTLTAQELTWLGTLKAGLVAGDFTAREFEAAAMLLEADWIDVAEFKALLNLT